MTLRDSTRSRVTFALGRSNMKGPQSLGILPPATTSGSSSVWSSVAPKIEMLITCQSKMYYLHVNYIIDRESSAVV